MKAKMKWAVQLPNGDIVRVGTPKNVLSLEQGARVIRVLYVSPRREVAHV